MFKIILAIAVLNIILYGFTYVKFKRLKKDYPSKDPATLLPVRRFLFAIIFIATTIYLVLATAGQWNKNFDKVEPKPTVSAPVEINNDTSDYIHYIKTKCDSIQDTIQKNECYKKESKTVTNDKEEFLKEMSKAINK